MTAIASWITTNTDRCGGAACVRDTRITVWGLVEWQRLGKTDAWLLDNFPQLNAADLAAAWEYAAAHPDEVDQAIRCNAGTTC
jgi:uncharacterized protein (DUF433 family)